MGLITRYIVFYGFICGIGSLIFGWETGMLNIIFSMRASFGAQYGFYRFDPQKHTFIETEDKNLREMLITPAFYIGGFFGNFCNLFLMDGIGRKGSVRLGAIVYMIGCLIQVCGSSVATLVIGRFIAGIASAITITISTLLLAELAPTNIRGALGIINSLGIQGGILLSSLVDTLCLKFITKNMTLQWRMALGGLLIPATLFLIFVWFLPETPRYLIMKKKSDRALKVLAKVRDKGDCHPAVVEEFENMNTKIRAELTRGICSWGEMFGTKKIVYLLIITSILQILHMLVGITAIGYFSTQIYSNYLNISLEKYGCWLNCISGLISFLCTIPAIKFIENFGRRTILKAGALGLGACMASITIFCLITEKTGSKATAWLCVAAIYLFSIIYSWSWSAVTFVWQAEVFPIRMRAKSNVIGSSAQYIGSIAVGATTTTLMKYLKYYTFLIYAGVGLIAFVFTHLCIRETKGIDLEDMHKLYGLNEDIPKEQEFKKNVDEKNEKNITKA